MAEPNKNDQALKEYFLRGMKRFEKHVHAEARNPFVASTPEAVQERIEAAYQYALTQLKENN